MHGVVNRAYRGAARLDTLDEVMLVILAYRQTVFLRTAEGVHQHLGLLIRQPAIAQSGLSFAADEPSELSAVAEEHLDPIAEPDAHVPTGHHIVVAFRGDHACALDFPRAGKVRIETPLEQVQQMRGPVVDPADAVVANIVPGVGIGARHGQNREGSPRRRTEPQVVVQSRRRRLWRPGRIAIGRVRDFHMNLADLADFSVVSGSAKEIVYGSGGRMAGLAFWAW